MTSAAPLYASLLFKYWTESRSRFALSLAALFVICAGLVAWQEPIRAQLLTRGPAGDDAAFLRSYAAYIHRFLYSGSAQPMCQFFALVLGLGGLLRERELRTAGWTLALPVRRWQLVWARAVVGLSQVVLLALLPAMVVPAGSAMVGETYAFEQAISHSALWIATHGLVFAMALLLSTLIAGQLTALLAGALLLVAQAGVAALPALRPWRLGLNAIANGTGMPYLDPHTGLLTALPWTRLTVMSILVVLLIALAARVSERQDF
jgi:ABC-type transport system involved in multi-copper enzyme maturation permease subunit